MIKKIESMHTYSETQMNTLTEKYFDSGWNAGRTDLKEKIVNALKQLSMTTYTDKEGNTIAVHFTGDVFEVIDSIEN